MLKSIPPVAMALCFSIIAFCLQHTDCPSLFTTTQFTGFKYIRFFICIRSYSYSLFNSLFIAAATAIEVWVEIYRCQISVLSSEGKTLLSGKRQRGSPKLPASLLSFFSFSVGNEKKLKKQFNILLLFWCVLFTDCNKNKRIIDLYVCYGLLPTTRKPMIRQPSTNGRIKVITLKTCAHVLQYCTLAA